MTNQKQNKSVFFTIKRLLSLLGISVALLCIPLVATLTFEDFNWSVFDFVVMGLLLFFVLLMLQWIRYSTLKRSTKIVVTLGVFFLFLLIWVELAVGIFD